MYSTNTDPTSLGHCPEGGRTVPTGWTPTLVGVERANREVAVSAEYPSREPVTRPGWDDRPAESTARSGDVRQSSRGVDDRIRLWWSTTEPI